MNDIRELTSDVLHEVSMIVFDVDGVLVPRGTKIKQVGDTTTFNTKKIEARLMSKIKRLHEAGFYINISSGRGLYMLQEMFRSVLPYVSLTYENGSATWSAGRIHQHVNSFNFLRDVHNKVSLVVSKHIKGFEPKEFIITIHCKKRVSKIESICAKVPEIYCIWNGEAYDIGVLHKQNKGIGLRHWSSELGINTADILAIGDNLNDVDLLKAAGITVTADKGRLMGHYAIPLNGKKLPGEVLIDQILKEVKK